MVDKGFETLKFSKGIAPPYPLQLLGHKRLPLFLTLVEGLKRSVTETSGLFAHVAPLCALVCDFIAIGGIVIPN